MDSIAYWLLVGIVLFATIAAAFWLSSIQQKRRSRFRRSYRGAVCLLASAFLVTSALALGLHLSGLALGITVSVVGIVQAMFLSLLPLAAKRWHSPSRTVVFIGKSRSMFNLTVLEGVREEISRVAPWTFVILLPEVKQDYESSTFQLEALRRPESQKADAVIILPVSDGEPICHELRQLSARGVFVVVIDFKIPNRVFYENGLQMPRFVGSDFREGGRLVARSLAEELERGDVVILLVGPRNSAPAMIRSKACLYELHTREIPATILCKELRDWRFVSAVKAFEEAVSDARLRTGKSRRVFVFGANDNLCRALSSHLDSQEDLSSRHQFFFLGYDGVRNTEGEVTLASDRRAFATVDTLPKKQGKFAGRLLLEEYYGNRNGLRKNILISPQLLQSPVWN